MMAPHAGCPSSCAFNAAHADHSRVCKCGARELRYCVTVTGVTITSDCEQHPSGTGSLLEVMNTLLPHQMAIKPASQQVGMYFTTKKIKQLLSRSLGRPELAAFACLLLQVVPTSSSRRRFLLAGLPVLPVVWVSHPVPRLRNRSRKS